LTEVLINRSGEDLRGGDGKKKGKESRGEPKKCFAFQEAFKGSGVV